MVYLEIFHMKHIKVSRDVKLMPGWLHGTAVERWSLTGDLSLFCVRLAADGRPLMWVNRPL